MIDELEGLDRARYAGPVGWMDAEGNGRWAVALRCAELDGATARLYAGVGVVRESDVDAELAETQAKLAGDARRAVVCAPDVRQSVLPHPGGALRRPHQPNAVDHRSIDPVVLGDVGRPLRGHPHHPHATSFAERRDLGDAVHRSERDEVDAVGSAEEPLERVGGQGRGLRQEREDAASVVVDDDDREVDVA